MNAKYNFSSEKGSRIVYVRMIEIDELPDDVKAEAEAQGLDNLYAVHSSEGERLALVHNKSLAFALARQNDMAPVNVH